MIKRAENKNKTFKTKEIKIKIASGQERSLIQITRVR